MITIDPVNAAPVFTSDPVTEVKLSATYSYNVTTQDENQDVLGFVGCEVPSWITFIDNGDGTASLTGDADAAGDYDVKLVVTDGKASVEQLFTITVVDDTALEEAEAFKLEVYPVPAATTCTVKGCRDAYLMLTTIQGVVVYEQTADGDVENIDVTTLNNGVYLLSVTKNNQRVIKRIVIEK